MGQTKPKPKYKDLGATLRRVRISKKITQQAAADHLGIRLRTYTMYETGESNPIEAMKGLQDLFHHRLEIYYIPTA